MTHEQVIQTLAVHKAQRRADLGPVLHPRQHVIDAHGVRVFPGMKMYDTVSGQIVEVHHAGVANVATEGEGA